MNRHEHLECEHKDLAYCKRCRIVYCKDCNKEWQEYTAFTYTIDTTRSVPMWTYPPNTTVSPTVGNIMASCNHVEVS